MTDATGQLVSESTFYPFGHPRNEHEPRNVKEAYGFTQKERDGESGLNYFEARFDLSMLSRFASCDPLSSPPDAEDIASPQDLNAYAYGRNSPVKLVDPTGFTSEEIGDCTKTEGSRAWRNNNPGNIGYGKFAKGEGALRVESGEKGRFAVFPTEQKGMGALKTLLNGKSYRDLTPDKAMERYAPSKENDTNAYVKFLEKNGVDLRKKVGEQVDVMANAIKKYEGWKPGKMTGECPGLLSNQTPGQAPAVQSPARYNPSNPAVPQGIMERFAAWLTQGVTDAVSRGR
jgi:RHS repeat-associated protein